MGKWRGSGTGRKGLGLDWNERTSTRAPDRDRKPARCTRPRLLYSAAPDRAHPGAQSRSLFVPYRVRSSAGEPSSKSSRRRPTTTTDDKQTQTENSFGLLVSCSYYYNACTRDSKPCHPYIQLRTDDPMQEKPIHAKKNSQRRPESASKGPLLVERFCLRHALFPASPRAHDLQHTNL